jgi:hypothetical protein
VRGSGRPAAGRGSGPLHNRLLRAVACRPPARTSSTCACDLAGCATATTAPTRSLLTSSSLADEVPAPRRNCGQARVAVQLPGVWAVDDGSVIRVECRTGKSPVISADGSRSRIGHVPWPYVWFPADLRTVFVAWPGLGDVVRLETSTMAAMARTKASGQPWWKLFYRAGAWMPVTRRRTRSSSASEARTSTAPVSRPPTSPTRSHRGGL